MTTFLSDVLDIILHRGLLSYNISETSSISFVIWMDKAKNPTPFDPLVRNVCQYWNQGAPLPLKIGFLFWITAV
jgi:hypothetical protein